MKTAFYSSFERDLKKLKREPQTLVRIQSIIEDVESAVELGEIPNVSKLTGGNGQFYRIRVGEYRIGLELEGEIVVFVRCLHRREIYRSFP